MTLDALAFQRYILRVGLVFSSGQTYAVSTVFEIRNAAGAAILEGFLTRRRGGISPRLSRQSHDVTAHDFVCPNRLELAPDKESAGSKTASVAVRYGVGILVGQ